ncbi:hypothetical protein LKW28_01125 [Bacillus sp. REN16]|nr:hypothetical protein [Bacillus sp. REN16]MCC3355532.1 hypothetical protein [Bacillus sp. REN16]
MLKLKFSTSLKKDVRSLNVGVISHVQELRARLPKRLIVEPAKPFARGHFLDWKLYKKIEKKATMAFFSV